MAPIETQVQDSAAGDAYFAATLAPVLLQLLTVREVISADEAHSVADLMQLVFDKAEASPGGPSRTVLGQARSRLAALRRSVGPKKAG